MKIISRKEAKQKGMKRYFTGNPCRKGHVSERLVSTRLCRECDTIFSRQWHRDNTEHCREYDKRRADQVRVKHNRVAHETAIQFDIANPAELVLGMPLIHLPATSFHLPLAWDSLNEKTVQRAIQHTFPTIQREVNLDGNYLDMLTVNHTLIEVKKSYAKPPQSIGQLMGYKSSYCQATGLGYDEVQTVIMLFGSTLGLWETEAATNLRNMLNCRLWVLVSLANPEIIDADTGEKINLHEE